MSEILLVSLGASNRRFYQAQSAQAKGFTLAGEPFDRPGPGFVRRHDPAFPDLFFSDLKLRFYQRHPVGLLPRELQQGLKEHPK
jgi:hypothetical protein